MITLILKPLPKCFQHVTVLIWTGTSGGSSQLGDTTASKTGLEYKQTFLVLFLKVFACVYTYLFGMLVKTCWHFAILYETSFMDVDAVLN